MKRYKSLKQEYIREIDSEVKLYEHVSTGLKVLAIENKDSEKVFNIGFKTLPEDNTGVMHILEHCVLSGSKKYDVKEPFVYMAKTSLSTYLNAMTDSDKTMYPVASKNGKDFENLMDVYLDAVFNPLLRREDFMQEGWYYSYDEDAGNLLVNGIVYNEMKGFFSSPDAILHREIQRGLYPDTVYGFECGGDPLDIIDLTYEKFKSTYDEFYHPSNAFIVLYGDMDTNSIMEYIDKNYLQNYNKRFINKEIVGQENFNVKKEYRSYYSPIGEVDKSSSSLAFNYRLGNIHGKMESVGMGVVASLLCNMEASILRKVLVEENFCDEVEVYINSDVKDKYLSIILKGVDPDCVEDIENRICEVIESVVENGFDSDLIEACLNNIEFSLKEKDYGDTPIGIMYSSMAISSWVYGVDTLDAFKSTDKMKEIKKLVKERYLEGLLEKYILNSVHRTVNILSPDSSLDNDLKLRDKISKKQKDLSLEDIGEIIRLENELEMYNNRVDLNWDCIPVLSVDDLDKKIEPLSLKEEIVGDTSLLIYDKGVKDIVYSNLLFDISDLSKDDLKLLNLLSSIILSLGTKDLDSDELSIKLDKTFGNFSFCIDAYGDIENSGAIRSYLKVEMSYLIENMERAMNLFETICNDFEIKDTEYLISLINEELLDFADFIIEDESEFVLDRLYSKLSARKKYLNDIDGLDYYLFLKEVLRLVKNKSFDFNEIYRLKEILKNKISIAYLVSSMDDLEESKHVFVEFIERFNSERKQNQAKDLNMDLKSIKRENELIYINTDVNCNVLGCNYLGSGKEYNGSIQVLSNILNYDYLWNLVRVQGGAYGCSVKADISGNIRILSYRDPNIDKTFKTYHGIADYLRNLDIDKSKLDSCKIGALNATILPSSVGTKSEIAFENYIYNITDEFRQKELDEILSTTIESIKAYDCLFDYVSKNGISIAYGSEKKLEMSNLKGNRLILGKIL